MRKQIIFESDLQECENVSMSVTVVANKHDLEPYRVQFEHCDYSMDAWMREEDMIEMIKTLKASLKARKEMVPTRRK
jgi:hypothetical protein